MTRKPDELLALEVTEAALGDVVALFGAYLDGGTDAERSEVARIVELRRGETSDEAVARIRRTVGLAGLLGSTFLDLAAGLIDDPDVDSRHLLQRYALRLTAGHERRRVIACRCTTGESWVVARCPLCLCEKSRDVAVPNRTTSSCTDRECLCHTYEETT